MGSEGIVKRWMPDRGFGFLMPVGGGVDVFVHRTELRGRTDLAVGDKVKYDRVDDGQGRGKALRVEVMEGASAGGLFPELPAGEEDSSTDECPIGIELFSDIVGDEEVAAFLEDFVLESSLQARFIVVSDTQLVQDIRGPSDEEFSRLMSAIDAFVVGCEARNVVMLTDFEGEMPGHGGELATAQFQLTDAFDGQTLVPRVVSSSKRFRAPGLLVDMRNHRCISVVRRIMESEAITKLIWGGDGDFQSLMYQQLPEPLQISPVAVVDVQLGFDTEHRIGMARMLGYVRPELLAGLPDKEQIDWDEYHSQNRRALPLPMKRCSAMYAIDDLHRIDAIVGSKQPLDGNYAIAREATENILTRIRGDPYGILTLGRELKWLQKLHVEREKRRAGKAVQLMRHVLSIRYRDAELNGEEENVVKQAQDSAAAVLEQFSVEVPMDLSFCVDP